MNPILKNNAGLLLVGLTAGFLSATLGIGGGVVMVPLLSLFFSYDMKKAIGTSIATIVPTTCVGVITHYIIASNNIKWLIVLFTVAGSVVGAKLGAELAKKLHSKILKNTFAALIVFTGLKMLNIIKIPTQAITNMTFYPALTLLGLAAGGSSALFGIGGGVIMVPVMNLFFGLTMHQAVATSLTVMLPTAFTGAIYHNKFGHIHRRALLYLIPTALVGAISGAIFANSMPSETLKTIFGVFLFCAAALMLIKKEKKFAA